MGNKLMVLVLLFFLLLSLPVRACDNNIRVYHENLEKCMQKSNTEQAQSDAEILSILEDSSACIQELGYLIIDCFYTKNKLQAKENFDNFIRATTKIENDICTKSDLNLNNMASIREVTAATSSLHLLKGIIEDMIALVEWDLEDHNLH